MNTYKAQVRVAGVVAITLIQADNLHNAKLLLTHLYGVNSLLNVLQVK
jgi:flagellar biosynthesis/type III secretory pathway chaperone